MKKTQNQKLLDAKPRAIDIRKAGTCDICHQEALLSYTFPEYQHAHPDKSRQYCGYFCTACGFARPGDREKTRKK